MGYQGCFFGHDFITVSKTPKVEWPHLRADILGTIMEHIQSGQPFVRADMRSSHHSSHGATDAHTAPDDNPVIQKIKELLDTRVRPAVAQDGGDITFHGFERGVVYLYMQGACAGCPSSTLTLKMGIENLLRHYIPEVVEVRPLNP